MPELLLKKLWNFKICRRDHHILQHTPDNPELDNLGFSILQEFQVINYIVKYLKFLGKLDKAEPPLKKSGISSIYCFFLIFER